MLAADRVQPKKAMACLKKATKRPTQREFAEEGEVALNNSAEKAPSRWRFVLFVSY